LRRLPCVARVGVSAADLEQRGHRLVREAVHTGLRTAPRPAPSGGRPARLEPQDTPPTGGSARSPRSSTCGRSSTGRSKDGHVQLPLSRRGQVVELLTRAGSMSGSHEDTGRSAVVGSTPFDHATSRHPRR
jgi:hypothetical protein